MHGAGNDYIYINAIDQEIDNPSKLALMLSNRHFGIGSDGLVLILPSDKADIRMQMFNADGTEAEMCGNASRCVGKYVFDHQIITAKEITLETKAGIKHLYLKEGNQHRRQVTVDMGEPILEATQIPLSITTTPAIDIPIQINNNEWHVTCVSMGNPHAVVFTEQIENLPLHAIGPLFESHPLFPQKTNTEFIEVLAPNKLKMRVWERGAGETLACGTGACAATVAAVLKNIARRNCTVSLPGGELEIEWSPNNNHVYMTGEAVTVFSGTIYI